MNQSRLQGQATHLHLNFIKIALPSYPSLTYYNISIIYYFWFQRCGHGTTESRHEKFICVRSERRNQTSFRTVCSWFLCAWVTTTVWSRQEIIPNDARCRRNQSNQIGNRSTVRKVSGILEETLRWVEWIFETVHFHII